MKRIIIICEGETEQEFCVKTLYPHFFSKHFIIQSPLIKKSMGGIVNWKDIKKQIEITLENEPDVFVTMLIDFYGVYTKHKFPNWEESKIHTNKNTQMDSLEEGMKNSIDEKLRYRFIPYIQLHEFEGLLFNDINIFYSQIPKKDLVNINELQSTFAAYENPEMINNSKQTSPSHRLERIISGYNKIVYGNILAEAIGLNNIRLKSPRFNNWISKLESL
jgi:hypothetical protein